MAAKTRLGLSATTRAPYGSFAGKTTETITNKLLKLKRGFNRGVLVGVGRGMN